jgi:hypothetical protein
LAPIRNVEGKMAKVGGNTYDDRLVKTSFSDPLRIAVVTAGPQFGRIGIIFCPGKYDPEGGKYDGGVGGIAISPSISMRLAIGERPR